MSDAPAERWAYSTDEETYSGGFSSWRDAALEVIEGWGEESVYVGQCITPKSPESFIDGDSIIERIWDDEHEHYCGDWVDEKWPNASREQIDELTADLRAAMGRWLDRHGLRPKWFVIDHGIEITREQAEDPDYDPFRKEDS